MFVLNNGMLYGWSERNIDDSYLIDQNDEKLIDDVESFQYQDDYIVKDTGVFLSGCNLKTETYEKNSDMVMAASGWSLVLKDGKLYGTVMYILRKKMIVYGCSMRT